MGVRTITDPNVSPAISSSTFRLCFRFACILELHQRCHSQGLHLASRRFEHLQPLVVATLSSMAFLHLPFVHVDAWFTRLARPGTVLPASPRARATSGRLPAPPCLLRRPGHTGTTRPQPHNRQPGKPVSPRFHRPVATYPRLHPSTHGSTNQGRKGGIRGDAEGGIGFLRNRRRRAIPSSSTTCDGIEVRADVQRRMRERRSGRQAWKATWELTEALANETRRGYPSYPSLQSNGNLVRQAHAIEVRTTGSKGTSEAERSRRGQVISGSAYCFASAGMVLMNKLVLSSYDFHAPNALLFYQTAVCLALVMISKVTGMVKTEPLSLKIVKVWFPVNLIFVGMLWSSFISLQLVGVAMVTVLKNLANIITICGDTLIYNRRYNIKVWLSLFLMVVSAVCGSLTDLTFTSKGYVYQLLNCCFTAFYSLHLRSVMDKVKTVTTNKSSLSEFSMVYYNNLLSLPLMFLLALYFGEIPGALQEPALDNPWFVCAATFSGVLGFGISFASLWFLSQTTATTYSLVGSLNKIPLAVLGILLFNTPTTISNLASIFVGLAAGVLFVRAKQTGVQK